MHFATYAVSKSRSRLCVAVLSGFVAVITCQCSDMSKLALALWISAQTIPHWTILLESAGNSMQQKAWDIWETKKSNERQILDVDVLDLSRVEDAASLDTFVAQSFGSDWRRRPLYIRGLWNESSLSDTAYRRLSLDGLLREELTIPFFKDATIPGALTPESRGSIKDIVANMTRGHPHKITSQFIVQTYPEVVREVAPTDIVTQLFGNYFEPRHVKGNGWFPATTTVPVFVAPGGSRIRAKRMPSTDIHCEPIGNVAVQLLGEKQWTLVAREFSSKLRPSKSPDGRAYFAAYSPTFEVPHYTVTTKAGDALWIPTWMWHRVEYTFDGISVAASLFHFRPLDYIRNNPLYAALIVPAIVKEILGIKTQ